MTDTEKPARRKLTVQDHIAKLERSKSHHLNAVKKVDERIAALRSEARERIETLKAEAGIEN